MPCSPVWVRSRDAVAILGLLIVAFVLSVSAWPAGAAPSRILVRGAERSAPVTPLVFDGDVRDLPRPIPWKPGDPVRMFLRRFHPEPGTQLPARRSPDSDPLALAQRASNARSGDGFTTPTRNYPGLVYTGFIPADPVGDAGPNHYIQMVNGSAGSWVNIYDKAEPTPNLLATFELHDLGGGLCAEGTPGDPIVLHDRFADRWLLSEFNGLGSRLCVYISQAADPVSGGWYFYELTVPTTPDYPKYAVWPTDSNGGQGSYIVTANHLDTAGIYALDRGAMLGGTATTIQWTTIPRLPAWLFTVVMPADPDGPNAPATSQPVILMRHRDTESHDGPLVPGDVLEMYSFHVDWLAPGNTLVVAEPDVDTAEFDSDVCGFSGRSCLPQPGIGPPLDPLQQPLMWRLQYMNHGDHESLVGNFTVDIDGSDHAAPRWFELYRSGGGSWTVYQEGTYSIDDEHRWVGSIAMDQAGNLALGYNLTSEVTHPSLRYTGRRADDPPSIMSQPETRIHDGTSPNSHNHYGDYASMSLDPSDDCTFWFTGMDNTQDNWRTQVASFRFDACGCAVAPAPPAAVASSGGANRIDVAWNDSELETITEYLVRRSRTPGGPYYTVAVVPDSSPGVADGPGYVHEDTTVSGGIAYYYVVQASDGAGCKSLATNETSTTTTGACLLAPRFDGLRTVGTTNEPVCTLGLTWNPATTECGGATTYTVYRSTTHEFTPAPGNLLVSGISGTSYSDVNSLSSGTRYYYVVRSLDDSNGAEDENVVERFGTPEGEVTVITWTDDAGDTGEASMILTQPWQVVSRQGHFAPLAYATGDYNGRRCSGLTTPELRLAGGSNLTFWTKYDIENDQDKGEVQISTNGGSTWDRVPLSYPGTASGTADSCFLPAGTYFTGTDLLWTEYTADLSAWAGQDVKIRFVISSDAENAGQGWWIDDISITNVEAPGACARDTSCAENPFVDVEPEGPLALCHTDSPVLTANLSGGTGPFAHQWYRDGLAIPGATGTNYQPVEMGSFAYNVRVSSLGCDDEVFDDHATEVTLTDAPLFDGVKSVSNLHAPTCSVTVEWDPATAVCGGPIEYLVYRDTSWPVSPTPGNIVASGLTAEGWVDSGGLADGTLYYYLVRARDRTTGQSEANLVSKAAPSSGPGSGAYPIFTEDFEDPASFDDWTVTTGPGPHNCGEWARTSSYAERPSWGTGYYALATSDKCTPPPSVTSASLDSPIIDLDLPGLQSVTLSYDLYYNHDDGDDTTVEVWDGSQWQVIWTDYNFDVDSYHTFDVSACAVGNSAFQVRFNYQNAENDKWFSVDDIQIAVEGNNPCTTSFGPPPAPDGSNGTYPVRGDRVTPAGDSIDVTWDVSSCTADEYNLLYGNLGDVSGPLLSGSVCSIGASGSLAWSPVPAGDLYFLVVGTDGAGTESSWGTDSSDFERNGMTPSGECSTTEKKITTSCP